MRSIRLKYNLISLALLFPLIFIEIILNAQELDFDSLYHHNEVYKKTIGSVYDTMDIFSQNEILNITIESDFRNLVRQKYKGEYQPAVLRLQLSDSVVLTRHLQIKPRGDVRISACYFPPIMLNFSKKEEVIKHIKEFDKIKMVVKCNTDKINEQYLLSEYYAYKILNIMTDCSFRVRLIAVTYIDTGGRYRPDTSYAYIIESIDQLADRNNSIVFHYEGLSEKFINRKNLVIVYLYQYLIGNTDWSVPAGHNIEMIRSKEPEESLPYVIPYDFDYAGIVNADYAVPDASLNIENVRERLYRGICLDEEVIREAVKYFLDSKEKIYELYNSSQLLDNQTRINTLQYIDEFYQILQNDFIFSNNILENCR